MKKIILLCVLTSLSFSCTKEFLDAKPDISMVVPTTLRDLRPLLDYADILNRVPLVHGIAADDYFTTPSALLGNTQAQERNSYLWKADIYEGESSLDWINHYKQVFYANVVLEALEKLTPATNEQTEWNTLKGSALFIRTFAYYHLAQLYTKPYDASTAGTDLGVPLRLKADVNLRPGRGTVKELYDQMTKDIAEAVILLPEKTPVKSNPEKAAGYALQAWIYMATENYDAALTATENVLLYNNKLIDYSTLIPTAARPFPLIMPINKNDEALYYVSMNPSIYGVFSPAETYISTDLLTSYNANDLRRTLFFADKGPGLAIFKGNYSGNSTMFGGLATDDVYLMRAECYARKQNTSKAMEVLNSLLVTRWKKNTFVPYTAVDAEDALRKILVERRKELVGRGTRWMDLRRLNKDPRFRITLERNFNNVIYKLPPNDPRYVFPIPPNELILNPLEQNIR